MYFALAVLIVLCCFASFLSGFLYAAVKGVALKEKKAPELTETEKRKLERDKRDFDNFNSYNGDEQS